MQQAKGQPTMMGAMGNKEESNAIPLIAPSPVYAHQIKPSQGQNTLGLRQTTQTTVGSTTSIGNGAF